MNLKKFEIKDNDLVLLIDVYNIALCLYMNVWEEIYIKPLKNSSVCVSVLVFCVDVKTLGIYFTPCSKSAFQGYMYCTGIMSG